ncbi:MAG: hypothetical protein ACLU8W_02400 [Clostridia bacterium]
MRQIYDFERAAPPVLNENILRHTLERRRRRRQAVIAAVGGILLQIALILIGLLAAPVSTALFAVCLGCAVASLAGGTATFVIYRRLIRKGGNPL